MKLAELKIDPDFKNLLPPLDAETYTELEKDIVSNGLLDPILSWHGFIVDGHNRYEICKAHRIEDVHTREINKDSKSEVMQYIVDHQYARRILLKSDKVKVLLKVEEQMAKEAKERKLSNLKQNSEESNLTHRQDGETGRTAEIMAKKMGVSKNTWKAMKTVVTKGTPDQIKRLDKGGKGNGADTLAREVDDGTGDGERKCKYCNRILPISEFNDASHPFRCKECHNKMKREQREALKVMPDSLNPDIPIIVTSEMTITEFKNICSNMEFSLKQAIEINKQFLNESVVTEIINVIDGHINNINAIKRRIENETEGETVQI